MLTKVDVLKTIINVKYNLYYNNNFNELNESLRNDIKLINKFFSDVLSKSSEEKLNDEDIMVNVIEKSMKVTNQYIGKILQTLGHKFIQRTNINNKSYYVLSDKPEPHEVMDTTSYVHFTSPIRRFADLLTHFIVNYYLFNITDLNPDIYDENILSQINNFESSVKKVQTMAKFHYCVHYSDISNINKAKFIDFNYNSGKATFYVKELDIYIQSLLYHISQKNNISTLIEPDKITLAKINNQKYTINKDYISITLFAKPNEINIYDKLQIKISDPLWEHFIRS
jgi:exoribonuclease II